MLRTEFVNYGELKPTLVSGKKENFKVKITSYASQRTGRAEIGQIKFSPEDVKEVKPEDAPKSEQPYLTKGNGYYRPDNKYYKIEAEFTHNLSGPYVENVNSTQLSRQSDTVIPAKVYIGFIFRTDAREPYYNNFELIDVGNNEKVLNANYVGLTRTTFDATLSGLRGISKFTGITGTAASDATETPVATATLGEGGGGQKPQTKIFQKTEQAQEDSSQQKIIKKYINTQHYIYVISSRCRATF